MTKNNSSPLGCQPDLNGKCPENCGIKCQKDRSGNSRIYLTQKESEALITVFDNLLADSGMTVPDVATLEGVARILIKHRGYAVIKGIEVRDPEKIWEVADP
jgi:hypothetical protein